MFDTEYTPSIQATPSAYYSSPTPNYTHIPLNPQTMAAKKMWLKRALIPLWLIEIIVMGIFFVLGCIVLSWTDEVRDYDNTLGSAVT